jgi:hypothetical protein
VNRKSNQATLARRFSATGALILTAAYRVRDRRRVHLWCTRAELRSAALCRFLICFPFLYKPRGAGGLRDGDPERVILRYGTYTRATGSSPHSKVIRYARLLPQKMLLCLRFDRPRILCDPFEARCRSGAATVIASRRSGIHGGTSTTLLVLDRARQHLTARPNSVRLFERSGQYTRDQARPAWSNIRLGPFSSARDEAVTEARCAGQASTANQDRIGC